MAARSTQQRKKRRRQLLILFVCLILLYLWGQGSLKTTHVSVHSPKIHAPLRLVQLTDLHGMTFGKDHIRLLDLIADAEPDIIVVTGDMYSYKRAREKDIALKLMAQLAALYEVYFVTGEHDNDDAYHADIETLGITVLHDTQVDLDRNGCNITLAGVDNVYYSPTFDLNSKFTLDPHRYNVLLAHMPAPQVTHFDGDLVISGDSHGGLVRLPFLGAVMDSQFHLFPDQLGGEPTKGFYPTDNGQLFVSSGLGHYPFPLRIWNRPEIAVIDLLPE